MQKIKGLLKAWQALATRYFPEHQIYFRTNGKVRFVRIGTGVQLVGTAAVLGLTCWLLTTSAMFLMGQDALVSKQREIAKKERELAVLEARMASLNSQVRSIQGHASVVAERIEKRHQFLSQLLNRRLQISANTAQKRSQNVEQTRTQTAFAAPKDAAEAAVFNKYRQVEREQLAFASSAINATDARYKDTERLIRRLGLTPQRLVSQSSLGMGGPLVDASFKQGTFSSLEPQFKQLFLSWNRLDLLEKATLSIPSLRPVRSFTFTSSFGVRYDPFSGSRAMHTGVDLAGSMGQPIRAAAAGTVIRAAYWGAYGKVIEIDHGRGLTTRYGHLSNIRVRTGDQIEQGQLIGSMGNTGRSTGTHLHYEVRIDGRAVNPMPFLEASADVLEIQQRALDGSSKPRERF